MTHGIQLRGVTGVLEYSSDDVTWNQVDVLYVAAGGSGSLTSPAIVGREVLTVQMFVDAPPVDRKAIAHNVSVSGNTVSAWGGSESSYILVLMR